MDGADVVVARRQFAAECGDGGMGLGQVLEDGPRPLVRGERVRGATRVVLDPGDPVEAFRHRRAVRRLVGLRSGEGFQQLAGPLVGGQRQAELAGRLFQVADGDQALPRVPLGRGVRPQLGRQGHPQLQAPPQRRQRLGLRADLGRQLADVVVRLPQRRARVPVGLALEHVLQPLIEVARAAEQPGPQAVELLLLQQELLADPAVERLDGLERQVESGPLARVGEPEVVVGDAGIPVGQLQLEVGRDEGGIGAGLDGQDGGQPDGGRHQGRGARGHERPPPAHPPPRPLPDRLATGLHRLVGQPALDLLGQGVGRAVAIGGLGAPWPS